MSPKNELRCLLLDSAGDPVAKAVLESQPDSEVIQIRVLEDKVSEVLDHELLQMVGMSEGADNLLGRIERHRGDRIVLTRVKALGPEARRNFRMPAEFETFLYPLSGEWVGRRRIDSIDLSCGGVAFFCGEPLEIGERTEVVIPITEQPLVLRCQLLRKWAVSGREEPAYAVKFVDMCHDEEVLLREAVFGLQLQSRQRPAAGQ